jgi:hypothetical protein
MSSADKGVPCLAARPISGKAPSISLTNYEANCRIVRDPGIDACTTQNVTFAPRFTMI